jgi:hypothetical protein
MQSTCFSFYFLSSSVILRISRLSLRSVLPPDPAWTNSTVRNRTNMAVAFKYKCEGENVTDRHDGEARDYRRFEHPPFPSPGTECQARHLNLLLVLQAYSFGGTTKFTTKTVIRRLLIVNQKLFCVQWKNGKINSALISVNSGSSSSRPQFSTMLLSCKQRFW